MKKTLTAMFALLIAGILTVHAQSKKEIPPPPPPKIMSPGSQKIAIPESLNDFYKRNPSVANVGWRNDKIIVLLLKNGNTETYDLSKEEEAKNFKEKYGVPPNPPPPPPPPKRID